MQGFKSAGFLELDGLEEALPDTQARSRSDAPQAEPDTESGSLNAVTRFSVRQGPEQDAATTSAEGEPVRMHGKPLVWIDCEMTGLDVEHDRILEIACLVTDGALRTVLEGPEVAISHTDEVLDHMNEWSQEHHDASGLTERCRSSTVSMQQAEEQVVAFVKKHVTHYPCNLAGNSVHVDLLFLRKEMPQLAALFSHRVVDVSAVSELCFRWYPFARAREKGASKHTAMSDIHDSVEQLRWYKRHIFRPYKEVRAQQALPAAPQ